MKFSIIIAILLISYNIIFSQSTNYNIPKKDINKEQIYNTYLLEKDTKFGISFAKVNASSYFDLDGNIVATFIDTNYLNQYNRLYTIEFEQITFDFNVKQKITNNLSLQVNVPISKYTLNERYSEFYDSTNAATLPKQDKANLSLLMVDYINTQGIYQILEGVYELNILCTLNMPLGNQDGVARNRSDFWSDYAIEILPEINFGLNFEKFHLDASMGYVVRSEDLKDLLLTKLNIGLYSIPDTYISANIEWANSLVSFDNALPFISRKEPNMENYLQSEFLFGILLNENISADFSYRIKLLGKNSWNYFGYKIGLSYNL